MGLTYSAYGLTFNSELPCPELRPGTGVAQVSIRFARIPENLDHPTVKLPLCECEQDQYLLKMERVAGARFLVQGGKEILIQRTSDHHPDLLRLILLSTCMAAVLYQRKIIPLHGNAIVTNRGAVVFAGESGAGKSTLSLALMQRGFPVLTDDLCPVTLEDQNRPLVQPGIPRLKIWADALDRLIGATANPLNDLSPPPSFSGTSRQSLQRVRPELEKYSLPLNGSFHDQPQPIHKIYILKASAADRLALQHVTGMQKIEALHGEQFCHQYADGVVQQSLWFHWLQKVARQVDVAVVTRPSSSFCVPALADLVQEDFER